MPAVLVQLPGDFAVKQGTLKADNPISAMFW
jgi:hypothetical protein